MLRVQKLTPRVAYVAFVTYVLDVGHWVMNENQLCSFYCSSTYVLAYSPIPTRSGWRLTWEWCFYASSVGKLCGVACVLKGCSRWRCMASSSRHSTAVPSMWHLTYTAIAITVYSLLIKIFFKVCMKRSDCVGMSTMVTSKVSYCLCWKMSTRAFPTSLKNSVFSSDFGTLYQTSKASISVLSSIWGIVSFLVVVVIIPLPGQPSAGLLRLWQTLPLLVTSAQRPHDWVTSFLHHEWSPLLVHQSQYWWSILKTLFHASIVSAV